MTVMQWLPDTIDAMTRMLAEAGVIGSVAFLLAITIALLLWKHLGQILEVAKTQLSLKRDADTTVIKLLGDISTSNSAILERVGKLPSDKVECKAHGAAEVVELMKVMLAERGMLFSEKEIEIVLKHREAVADLAGKTTGEMPKPK